MGRFIRVFPSGKSQSHECRSDVLQLATVLTPNQFEAEQLTRSRISSQQDALRACLTLLVRGPKTVVSLGRRWRVLPGSRGGNKSCDEGL